MDLFGYFTSNFQIDYIPPKVSEEEIIYSFWNTLLSIPGTFTEYKPDNTLKAYFQDKIGESPFTSAKFYSYGKHKKFECRLGVYYKWYVNGSDVSFTRGDQDLDRKTWLAEFAEHFRKARSA